MNDKGKNPTKSKSLTGITGEFYVAAELGRRDIYAQVTMGNHKRTDLLVFSNTHDKYLKIEVKSKSGTTWPNCKGIENENSCIVFVDFEKVAYTSRPHFYILDRSDWATVVEHEEKAYKTKYPDRLTKIEGNVLFHLSELNRNGLPHQGCTIKVSDVKRFEDRWDKILERLA